MSRTLGASIPAWVCAYTSVGGVVVVVAGIVVVLAGATDVVSAGCAESPSPPPHPAAAATSASAAIVNARVVRWRTGTFWPLERSVLGSQL